jgi:hypothetical protein
VPQISWGNGGTLASLLQFPGSSWFWKPSQCSQVHLLQLAYFCTTIGGDGSCFFLSQMSKFLILVPFTAMINFPDWPTDVLLFSQHTPVICLWVCQVDEPPIGRGFRGSYLIGKSGGLPFLLLSGLPTSKIDIEIKEKEPVDLSLGLCGETAWWDFRIHWWGKVLFSSDSMTY